MRKRPTPTGARRLKELKLAKRRPDALRTIIKDHLPKMIDPGAMANALIASIGEGLIIINEYGEISQVNQPALDILGFERRELVGGWLPEVLPAYDRDGNKVDDAERPSMQSLLTGRAVSEINKYPRKDGSLVPVYGTASPLIVRGKPAGAVIVFRDISREMQIEQAKDEFVSIASHQLRTPLTAVKMFAELLQDSHYGPLTLKQADYLNKIIFSTDKMIELVTDLLSISRLNLGQLIVQPQSYDINKLLEEQLAAVKPLADKAGVKLSFNSGVPAGRKVPLDKNLLDQVVHNLLTNAIRYSRPKGGQVSLSLVKKLQCYQIEVADNGIGIPSAARHRVYERFFRADNAILAQGDGTGLGLYLVKEIVQASGGKIRYRSQEGKGTTFYVTFPLGGMKANQ